MTDPATNQENARKPLFGRWWQLLFGVICMSMIANLQYGWTLFVNPIDEKYEWGRAAIQVAFTIFVLTETWLVPIEGYLVDKYGPRIVVVIASVLVGVSWVLNSVADSLTMLYVAAAIGGIGAGAVYGTCVGNALKWFPDRRGLASGLTAMGFGAGSALTIIPISTMIQENGYEATFLFFGLLQGIVVFILGWFLVRTGRLVQARDRAEQSSERRDGTRARLRAARDDPHARVLGHVHDVRADGHGRLDGDGAARADCA